MKLLVSSSALLKRLMSIEFKDQRYHMLIVRNRQMIIGPVIIDCEHRGDYDGFIYQDQVDTLVKILKSLTDRPIMLETIDESNNLYLSQIRI